MTSIVMPKSVYIIGISIGLVGLLSVSSCVFFGNIVCFAPDAYYVADRKDVLSISGTTASHARLGLFTVDEPPITNKVYRGEGISTIVFTRDGAMTTASITIEDGTIKKYYFCGYGSIVKKRICGIYGPIRNAVEYQ